MLFAHIIIYLPLCIYTYTEACYSEFKVYLLLRDGDKRPDWLNCKLCKSFTSVGSEVFSLHCGSAHNMAASSLMFRQGTLVQQRTLVAIMGQ